MDFDTSMDLLQKKEIEYLIVANAIHMEWVDEVLCDQVNYNKSWECNNEYFNVGVTAYSMGSYHWKRNCANCLHQYIGAIQKAGQRYQLIIEGQKGG